ncbi:ABC transporter substrate-binding protein [Frondihabitans sucicola]|uniref:ABC transporter substrate-binding protein n=1 Tax=Frondihabitans sucicola TaxID=1268041 RepID=A0ABM8GLT2_9MICO|nr:ABC transporter substrate-binding protein [Frondihabitans sucicola]
MFEEALQKKTSRRGFLQAAGAVGIVTALAACSGPASTIGSTAGSSNGKIDKNGTIQAGIAYPLSTGFDPMTTTGAVTVAANWHILEGLVELDPVTRKVYPALAKTLPTVDGKTIRATLRDGAVFHDGSTVTADDVVFSFQRVLDPANASLYLTFIPFVASVTKVDSTTVEIALKEPTPLALQRLSVVKIVPKKVVTADPSAFDALPTGTGPYKITSATADDKITFVRFDGYTGPRPALAAAMTWNLLSDAAARVTAVRSGRVQAIEAVPYVDVTTLAKNATVQSVQSFGQLFMMFNCSQAPFDDKRVRQAFLYAVDYTKLVDTGLLGQAAPATSYLQKQHPSYQRASTVYTHDVAKAKKLLKAAGVGDLKITLLATNTDWVLDTLPLIKQDLAAIGVTATIDSAESGTQYKTVDAGKYTVMVAPGDPSVFGNDADLLLRWWYGAATVWPAGRFRWANSPSSARSPVFSTTLSPRRASPRGRSSGARPSTSSPRTCRSTRWSTASCRPRGSRTR